jgi:hypothetical protein
MELFFKQHLEIISFEDLGCYKLDLKSEIGIKVRECHWMTLVGMVKKIGLNI